MPRLDTKTRILDAAEHLFAAQGFTNTSLRQITTDANVNLASVNYHFGSKKSLIQAVLARYLSVYMPAMKSAIDAIEPSQPEQLKQLLVAMITPLNVLAHSKKEGAKYFMIMIGRGYSETQGHLRRYISQHYEQELNLILIKFSQCLPNLPRNELFWRLHYSLGTLVFLMTASSALSEIAEADFNEHLTVENILNKLVPYVAAGLTAEQI